MKLRSRIQTVKNPWKVIFCELIVSLSHGDFAESVLLIMESDLQGFIDRLSHLSLLNLMQLSIEIVVGNYVAITFSRLKSKPDKSKHHFKKLYKSTVSLKMIRIAISNDPNHVYESNIFQFGHFENWARRS